MNGVKKGLFYVLSVLFLSIILMTSAKAEGKVRGLSVEKGEGSKGISSIGDVDIEYGVAGYIRVSSNVRVKVSINKAKEDFTGSVYLKYYAIGDNPSSYSEEISIKKGENAEVYFYPFINNSDPSFRVSFIDSSGKELESYEDDIDAKDADGASEIVVASFLSMDADAVLPGSENFRIKRIYLKEDDITGDYRALSPFDLVIKPDDYEHVFKAETVDILKERDRQGGVSITESEMSEFNIKRLYLARENQNDWVWRVERVLVPVLDNLNIKSGKYIAIIFIYIIVVSPVTYLILARRKKRVQYWIFVPVWAVIFTVIIYMVSTDSRIDGIYMNYVSVLDLREGKDNENVSFSVTNSSNTPYTLEVNNEYKVGSLYGSFTEPAEKTVSRTVYNIENKYDGTDINVLESAAFDTLYLRARGTPNIATKSVGKFYRDNTVLKGEFTNTLGTDLSKVFAVYDDEIIYLGDVSKNETKSFSADKESVYLNDLTGSLQDSVYLNRIFDFAYEGENPKIQALMTSVLDKVSILGHEKPAFVALANNRLSGEFSSDVNTAKGYTLVVLPAEKTVDTGIESDNFVNSIGKLPMYMYEKSYSFSNDALVNRNSVDITYDVDIKKKVRNLRLFARYKEEVNPCRVYALNQLTDRYDVVFEPDEDYINRIKEYVNTGGKSGFNKGKDQECYMGDAYVKDGRLTLRYEIDQTAYDEISSFTIPNIPKISMEYE
jgi:hypothetical protein